ncbi:MAG: cobalt transporter [Melioribacteraceae bacterium]|nr:MAG: cobalt transporter [Melioribacteraceae bacterium]
MKQRNLSILAGWVSILFNILLFGLKYWVGIMTGSIALIADAWHTLSDSFSSLVLIFGTKYSQKPPDEDHPFGHGRAELITAVIIGVLLSIVAFSFLSSSVSRLIDKTVIVYGETAILITVLSIVVKEGLAQFALWAAKRENSPALRADAWHHRSDAISSIVILVGIFFQDIFWGVDGILGILVSLLIFHTAYEILRDAIDPLMGKDIDRKTKRKIDKICRDIAGEGLASHHYHLHEYGDHRELTFHIKLPNNMSLEKAHDIATRIESEIKEHLFIEATIHMEPRN